jgi:ornithine carbamoyltransferase
MAVRHFLTLLDLSQTELHALVARAQELKSQWHRGESYTPLKHRVLAMIFEKSSTRTRVSFEAAMTQFGGSAIFLSSNDTQLGRGEPVEDTAKVISRMVDCVMIRTFSHEKVVKFAQNSKVPVINALTDMYHPCQVIADIQTFVEQRGSIAGKKVAWVGDGNNMCHTYIHAAQQFDFQLAVASPPGYEPNESLLNSAKGYVTVSKDPAQAVRDADLVCTDVWASMGQEGEQAKRKRIFQPYQINSKLMALAKSDALFMHCLPAHRGEEVTADVIDGAQSVVWEEAENRLHSQKALLEFLLVQPTLDN